MLRFKIPVSVVPLIAAAILTRIEFFGGPRPCVALGSRAVEIASTPWHADLHVNFTDDPRLATMRVAISDSAEAADFTVVGDVETIGDPACGATTATHFVAVSARRDRDAPVIFPSHEDGPAEYRIFVHSNRFTDRQADALIVGAHGRRALHAAADL